MNLLLDTNALIWLMDASPNLSRTAVQLLADPTNGLYLSMASIWEMGIKCGLGKLTLTAPFRTFLDTAIGGYGLIVLSITMEDCVRYEALPFPNQ